TLKPLIDKLAAYENVDAASLVAAIGNSVSRLNALVTALNLDQTTDADKTSLAASAKVLAAAAAKLHADPRIVVRGAWYGDLDAMVGAAGRGRIDAAQDGRRFCSATKAVQLWCHGGAGTCTVVAQSTDPAKQLANGDGKIVSPLTGEKLCGYDPVPFAEDRI